MPADQPGGPFYVRAFPTDMSKPYDEEPFDRFGPALDRAQNMASAMQYRTAMVLDQTGTCWAQFNMLWIIPREVR